MVTTPSLVKRRKSNRAKHRSNRPVLTAFILAGGQSQRMGKDKGRLRLGSATLTGHAQAAGRAAGYRVRVIRHDLQPGQGPLGGIITAWKRSQADTLLFLSCDMPFVEPALLQQLTRQLRPMDQALFIAHGKQVGFPFLLRRDSLPIAENQLAANQRSLQALARALNARRWAPPKAWQRQLANLNTPEAFAAARTDWPQSKKRRVSVKRRLSSRASEVS